MSEIHARPLLLGAAKGVEYLHKKSLDLKLPNILYKSKRHALITDFSFAKEKPLPVLRFTWIRTLRYQSQGILESEETKGYNPYSADTWDYGCCLYADISGGIPSQALDKQQKEVKEEKVIEEAQVSDQARDLLLKTIIYDKKDQIPFHKITNHEWFRYNKVTYQSWPQSITVSPFDPSAPVAPLLSV